MQGEIASDIKRGSKLRKPASLKRQEAVAGFIYISPWLLGFLAFTAFPFLASFYLSFTDYTVVSQPRFAGFANYVEALSGDDLFWGSLRRTFTYAVVGVPLGILGSLTCALLLNQGLKGTTLFRVLFFLPSLTPLVALALLWQWIFQPDFGVLNFLLAKVGIDGPGWLSSIEWALPSLIIMALWGTVGGGQMVIFLAGLQGVPQELYEAVEIDGGGPWFKFRHVTLPMISPTMFFNLILGVIGALRVFTVAYVSTEGGPAYATWFYILHLYTQAFKYFNMGYASALAWLFFIILIAFTYLQVRASRHWVFYAGEQG
ncbi:MAG: sugar ABC transporter permease [Caldilineaceae bacterium]|nr:sugar ABC transporter permease [Caldilineaceae bacterium]